MVDPLNTTNRSVDDAPFFGRQTEIAWLSERLDRGERLLILSGPAHVGKSALLRQLVHRLKVREQLLGPVVDGNTASAQLAKKRSLRHARDFGCLPERCVFGHEHPDGQMQDRCLGSQVLFNTLWQRNLHIRIVAQG